MFTFWLILTIVFLSFNAKHLRQLMKKVENYN